MYDAVHMSVRFSPTTSCEACFELRSTFQLPKIGTGVGLVFDSNVYLHVSTRTGP